MEGDINVEWIVVTVIIALVGLFMTVGKPIISLNNNITLLNASIKQNSKEIAEQKQSLKEQKNHAHESHQKLWAHNAEQDKQLNDHELRLGILEQKDV